jgi:alpha-glucoside transport system substrate-binding protein
MKKISLKLLAIFMVLAFVIAACAPEPVVDPPGPPVDVPIDVPPEPEYNIPADFNEFAGESVSVIAVWGGEELESFMAMVRPWEEWTGASIDYEGTRDLNAVLTTRIEGGNPPDIAGLPGPGQLQQIAAEGHLVDLSTFMDMDELQRQYDQSWLDLASRDGGLYGLFTKVAVKSLVWYNIPAFESAGYAIPETWDELIELSDQIVADDVTPWCIGIESGAASGWPFTDWIEDFMLRTAGPDLYDQWANHEIPWTHEAVRNAWETAGVIFANEAYLNGGPTGVLATDFGESVYPVFEDPPGCYLHRQATFIQGFIEDQFPDLVAFEDYDYFLFPEIDPEFGKPILSAGDLFGMFNDTPAARSLIEWLAGPESQEIWASRGGFISANTDVDTAVYPDPVIRQAAELLVEADIVRFDASDMMPAAVNDAFWAGALEFVENPDNLDQILENIEAVALEAYAE